jgi:CubicO group peptidase (beta-lactamase class C family)
MNDTFVNRWGLPPKSNLARSYANSSLPAESVDVVNCNTIYGDGSVFSTAHDLALWNLYLDKNVVVGTTASMDEAYQPGKTSGGDTFQYGFGWGLTPIGEMKQYAHGGAWAGYRTQNVRLPEKQFAVAVLANSGRADLNAVVKKAIEAYLQ